MSDTKPQAEQPPAEREYWGMSAAKFYRGIEGDIVHVYMVGGDSIMCEVKATASTTS